jgi:hypothetical protein
MPRLGCIERLHLRPPSCFEFVQSLISTPRISLNIRAATLYTLQSVLNDARDLMFSEGCRH